MLALVSKIQKVTKAKKDLQRSLASSKQASLAGSPRVSTKRKPKTAPKQQPTRTVMSKSSKKEDRSEYDDVLKSFLKIKQGSSNYNDIVANAMEATDNLLAYREGQSSKHASKSKNVKVAKHGTDKHDKDKGSGKSVNADAIFSMLDKHANRGDKVDNEGLASSLLAALTEEQYQQPDT